MGGIDEDETGDELGMAPGEHPGREAAERMADQDVRRRHAGASQQRAEFVGEPADGAWGRSRLAPSEPAAIVGAGGREARHLRLDDRPAERRAAERGVEHDRGAARPDAVQVQAVGAHIDETTRRRNRRVSHLTLSLSIALGDCDF